MIQSEARITSRLCSITDQRMAGGEQLAEGAQQLGDVVEVQAGGRLVEQEQLGRIRSLDSASARWPASFRRCASPPESVGTGWPRRRYSRPTSIEGLQPRPAPPRACGKRRAASRTVISSTSAIDLPSTVDLEDLGAEALAVAVRAAQVDVGEELHLDVLEAVAAAGRAAAVAGVEAEGAGGVAALLRRLRSLQNRFRIASKAPT